MEGRDGKDIAQANFVGGNIELRERSGPSDDLAGVASKWTSDGQEPAKRELSIEMQERLTNPD